MNTQTFKSIKADILCNLVKYHCINQVDYFRLRFINAALKRNEKLSYGNCKHGNSRATGCCVNKSRKKY